MQTNRAFPALASLTLIVAGLIDGSAVRAAEPPATSVAEIQARHDRALIRDLTEYLRRNPRADDRDQAYAALFNKAIEHDWFAETEELGRQYLQNDPEGPVKALAQIILTMARSQAGQFDRALAQYRQLIQGLDANEQEEFAASFSESLAQSAVGAGEVGVARQVYALLLSRFGESPNLRQKVEGELKRLDQVGKPAPAVVAEDVQGQPFRPAAYRGKYVLIDFWATWCGPCIADLPRLQAAYQSYHDAGFEIIGVSLDESKQAVVDFVKARRLPWRQIHNTGGSADLVDAFGVRSIPANYLIDPEGTILRLDLRGKALDQTLSRLFTKPVGGATAR
ncbi:MAG TPA: TlpA disulfide reductase family protein [Isosphaeraceae bacterium]|nr:TlpA disulfide reductase family protein [Isosphaeraceae bacterium]